MNNAMDIIKSNSQRENILNEDPVFSNQKIPFLIKGGLTLLAGRPAMGKTTMALNLVNRFLLAGESVCYVTLGGSELEIINRYLDMFDPHDLSNLFFESRAYNQLTARELINSIKKHNPAFDLIVIDYIQLLGIDQIQWLYDSFPDSAVLLLCQAARTCDERDDHHIRCTDIPEWTAIEPYLCKALSIFRKDYYDNESEERSNLMEISFLKGFAQNQYKILTYSSNFVLSNQWVY